MPPEFNSLPPEWQKTIRDLVKVAKDLSHGEITIKVQDRKAQLVEYTVKRKPTDAGDFQVMDLSEV